jgi:hypothetical protein
LYVVDEKVEINESSVLINEILFSFQNPSYLIEREYDLEYF